MTFPSCTSKSIDNDTNAADNILTSLGAQLGQQIGDSHDEVDSDASNIVKGTYISMD